MSSAPHVIVGAGPVGSSLARILAGDGEPVIVVTRSGSELGGDGIRSIAADASDPEALTRIASGAAAIYNCANPGSYTQWERLWPPLGSALLTAAESTGAVLVTMSNLYGYGPVTEPMTAQMPLNPTDHKGALRARMWEEARAAHEAGRIRATEARASDYIGPTLPAASGLLARYAQATLVGKPASVFADPDVPHAWTAIDDVARTLVMLGRDERAWNRFLAELDAMGMTVLITELDCADRHLSDQEPARRDAEIAAFVKGYLDITLSHRNVSQIICWGLSDRYSNLNRDSYPTRSRRPDGLPMRGNPFDDALRPKPFYDAIATALAACPAR